MGGKKTPKTTATTSPGVDVVCVTQRLVLIYILPFSFQEVGGKVRGPPLKKEKPQIYSSVRDLFVFSSSVLCIDSPLFFGGKDVA